MEEKFFVGIISHKKSLKRDEQRKVWESFNSEKLIYYYFVGDPTISEEYLVDEKNRTVTLKVEDNYESLSKKTRGIIKFYLENYFDSTLGLVKTDDDIEINPNLVLNLLEKNSEKSYFGLVVNVNSYYESTYHWGKCESEEWNRTRAVVPESKYCAGGGYYINRETASRVVDKFDIYDSIIFEDVATGVILNRMGVFPENFEMKENGFLW